jgi:hypothetical protein
MQRYGIIKQGNGFVIQAEALSVLKCSSRRKAARAVSDALDLIRAEDSSQQVTAAKEKQNIGE